MSSIISASLLISGTIDIVEAPLAWGSATLFALSFWFPYPQFLVRMQVVPDSMIIGWKALCVWAARPEPL